jgi:hypothetical protein
MIRQENGRERKREKERAIQMIIIENSSAHLLLSTLASHPNPYRIPDSNPNSTFFSRLQHLCPPQRVKILHQYLHFRVRFGSRLGFGLGLRFKDANSILTSVILLSAPSCNPNLTPLSPTLPLILPASLVLPQPVNFTINLILAAYQKMLIQYVVLLFFLEHLLSARIVE